MDISLIPLCIYKIPKNCTNLLITPNLMFTILDRPKPVQSDDASVDEQRAGFNVGVVSSNTSELRIGEDSVRFIHVLDKHNPI